MAALPSRIAFAYSLINSSFLTAIILTPCSLLFIQFQEALFKGSGELELLIYTAEDNDNKTSIDTLDLTGAECFVRNDSPGVDL